jgi:hypothetical protein
MEKLRAAGHLKPNHFASFERIGSQLSIQNHGDAQTYLSSDRVRETAIGVKRGVIPAEAEHDGWLGAYRRTLASRLPHPQAIRVRPGAREKGGRGR